MGCSTSRPDDLAELARRSAQDNKALWFDAPAAESDADTETNDSSAEEAAPALDYEERSLLRARTLLEIRMHVDQTGGRFTDATLQKLEADRLAQAVASLGVDTKLCSPRTAVRRWYESEALAAASRRSSSADQSTPSLETREAEVPQRTKALSDHRAAVDNTQPPVPLPRVSFDEPPPPIPVPLPRSSFDEPPPVEEVAQRALETLQDLLSATGGRFTECTIPPRMLARLHHDVARGAPSELEPAIRSCLRSLALLVSPAADG